MELSEGANEIILIPILQMSNLCDQEKFNHITSKW